ncbi:MAG: DUF1080 domain-containing protein [Pirellulales bacterium]|nr:DUF1080 domain-containing protein [Pirellulales bacterium]
MRFSVLGLVAAGVMCAAATASALEFVPLFDGKSIDGWIKRGGKAEYRIEEGAIVGVSQTNTENTFLCTPRDYADFVLEVEVKVDAGLNSGIQIRSLCKDEPQEFEATDAKGKPIQVKIPAKRVHGYQVEIDPSERAYSGGIYDEARRGWLFDLPGDEHKAARGAFKVGQWNKYRIECRGPSIKTWINDVPVADLSDEMTPAGFIGLQVHSIGGDEKLAGKEVRWRNLRIAEINTEE